MKLINEQNISATAENGKIRIADSLYQLEVNPGIDVDVKKIIPLPNGGFQLTGSALFKTKVVPVTGDTLSNIIQGINQKKTKIEIPALKKGGLGMTLTKLNETINMKNNLSKIIKRVLREQEAENYMFFSNLEQIKRQCDMLLNLDQNMVDEIIQQGHDWADDHISEAKTNLDQVFDFLMNEKRKMESYVEYEDINEGKKKAGTKLCSRGKAAAKAKFKVYPSAYANGYAVQVCKGKMPGTDGKKRCSAPYC